MYSVMLFCVFRFSCKDVESFNDLRKVIPQTILSIGYYRRIHAESELPPLQIIVSITTVAILTFLYIYLNDYFFGIVLVSKVDITRLRMKISVIMDVIDHAVSTSAPVHPAVTYFMNTGVNIPADDILKSIFDTICGENGFVIGVNNKEVWYVFMFLQKFSNVLFELVNLQHH